MGLIKKEFKPNSTFISKIEYSYLPHPNNDNINLDIRISELITVWFCDGSIVEYKPPFLLFNFDFEEFYNRFISSVSVGKFWHKEIKSKLEWKKIR